MESTIMKPIKKWHTNSVLKGWDGDDKKDPVHDLPVTRIENNGGVVSIWKIKSIWQRVKFLFHGEITFQTMGTTHPPVSFYCGDVITNQNAKK